MTAMMMRRQYSSTGTPQSPSAAARPLLPGLLSALRPVVKLTSQIKEEAQLLSRFTYKNKNQHKACGWWRAGIVQVDRVLDRAVGELEGLGNELKNGQ